MSGWYSRVVRPLLFRLSAETAHSVAAFGLGIVHRVRALQTLLRSRQQEPTLRVEVLGQSFESPLCLAAGFDKSATMYNALGALGFAAVEVGTVTAVAQDGNPKPRLFRLPLDQALVNRMGFNNPGADAVAHAIESHPPEHVVLGINLGKSRIVALEDAPHDYAQSTKRLCALADYLVVNVSSPNTPGLRSLQSVRALRAILVAVQEACAQQRVAPPLLVKIAPDLEDADVDEVTDLCIELGVSGVIASNTTLRRDGLRTDDTTVQAAGAGGLSGPMLRPRMLEIVRRVARRARGALVIIAAGGIADAEHAWQALQAGASLVQVYTAFVYKGPGLARELNRDLRARVMREGYTRLADALHAMHSSALES